MDANACDLELLKSNRSFLFACIVLCWMYVALFAWANVARERAVARLLGNARDGDREGKL